MSAIPALGREKMSDTSDWDLIEKARSGDMVAFSELVRRYERPVVHFCQRMIGSREDAEDLAQDSFVRVYRYLDRLTQRAKFSTLLFGIARNLTLNFIRDSSRRGRGTTFSLTDDENIERSLVDDSRRPDREARLHEIDGMLKAGLAQLSPKHREVLVLRELQGLDYSSIAKIVKCRKGTVKSRIARARDQLRRHLERMGGLEL